MSDRLKANLLKYGISTVIVAVMVGVYVGSRDFLAESRMEQYRILCDAFTIPGTVFLMLGALMKLSNLGALDALSYAVSWLAKRLIPGRAAFAEQEKYYEYVQRKRENQVKGYGFLVIVGAIAMAVALVFLFLFYRLYN